MNKKIILIVVSIFIFLLSASYLFPGFLISPELRIHDSFFQFSRYLNRPSAHKDEIVIIALDDVSFWRLEKKDPYPRSVYAELFNIIKKGKPKFVFFDIVFRGSSADPKEDEVFAEALKGNSNVFFPYHMGKKGVHVRSEKAFYENEMGAVGYINKVLDSEGRIRRLYPFRLKLDGKIKDYTSELYLFSKYYDCNLREDVVLKNRHVSLKNLKSAEKDQFKRYEFSLLGDNTMWINYKVAFTDFDIISMYKVFLDNFDPSIFKDKIVFIGKTSGIFHDIHNTPLGVMPGTGIVANTVLMFLDGEFIHGASLWFKWFLVFVFCMLMVFLCYRMSVFKGLLFTMSIASIISVLAFWLFLKGYYLNPFKLVFTCAVSYVVINFYKYASVVMENMHLRRLSTTDELTGLHTFRFFSIVINHEFQKCLRYQTPLSLIMIDIDNFKNINDTYGHQKGNVVLKKIGSILINNARKADFSTRYGGEELAILLPNTDVEGASKCAENMRQFIEKENYFETKQGPLKVTVSVGVSAFPSINIASAEEMIKFSDIALYKAKHQGKNQVVIYSPDDKE